MVMDFPPTRHDPHTDRNGIELLPGVYAAFIGGCLHPFSHRIVLTAYVYDSALPDREMWECYLRMHMLSVLMHEVGHHVDGVTAQKPLPCEYDRREQAAECYAAIWTRAVVIPYLREQYADAVQALEAWVTEWAGQSITLDQLIDDPPALPGEPGWTAPRWLLPPRTLLSHLAYAVAQGKSRHAIHDWYRDYLAFQCMTCGDT